LWLRDIVFLVILDQIVLKFWAFIGHASWMA
jgi:hypothetical protein